jgi:polysaccharide biosynthesis protein PslH
MKVLQICFRVPFPPHDGGAIAMYDIAHGLTQKGHDVQVLAVNTPKHFQKEDVLQGVAKLKTVFVDTTISPLKAFLNLFKNIPYNVERFISKDFEAAIVDLLKKETFDIIHVEGTFVAYYIDVIRKHTKTPVVLRAHNVEYLIWQRLAANETSILKKIYKNFLSKRLMTFEREYFQKYDTIAGITEQDNDRITALGVSTPKVFIPAGVQLQRFKIIDSIKAKPNTMFIISSLNWLPNLEGLDWFVTNVWPHAKAQNKDLELHIAGKDTPEQVRALAGNGIFIHGYVADASVFMQEYDMMLVPLLSGGGMRLKIIEGMALGKAILTSTIGAEGISCESGKDIFMKDKASEWVALIAEYFQEHEKFEQVGAQALNLIRDEYDNDKVVDKLVGVYNNLLK